MRTKVSRPLDVIIIYLAFFLRGFSFIILSPLYTRVLEKDVWGAILASQALIAWLSLLFEYGFSLSFASRVASQKQPFERLKMFSAVLSAKIILFIPAILIVFLFSRFGVLSQYKNFALLALLVAIIQAMCPAWYYQALERMRLYSVIEIMTRVIFFALSIIFIRQNADSYKVLFFQIIILILLAGISNYILYMDGVRFAFRLSSGFYAIKEGWALASYTMITGIYSGISVLILGLFVTPHAVAIYGSGDRILRAGLGLLGPLNQIMLPVSARSFSASHDEGMKTFKRLAIIYSGIAFLGFSTFFLFNGVIVKLLFGTGYSESARVVKILAFLFPLVCINTTVTYHFLVPNRFDREVTAIYISASIISAITMFSLVPILGNTGMLISVILPEALVTIIGILLIRRILVKRVS